MTQYPTQESEPIGLVSNREGEEMPAIFRFCPHDNYVSMVTLGVCICFMLCGVSALFNAVILI